MATRVLVIGVMVTITGTKVPAMFLKEMAPTLLEVAEPPEAAGAEEREAACTHGVAHDQGRFSVDGPIIRDYHILAHISS